MPRHNQTLVTKWSLCDIRVAQLESTYLVQKGNSKNSWRKLWENAHTRRQIWKGEAKNHEDQNQDNDNDELQSKQPNRQTDRRADWQSVRRLPGEQAAGNICHNWQRIYAMLIKGLWGKSFHPGRQTDTHTYTHTLGVHESCAKGEFHFLSAQARHRGRERDSEMTMLGVAQVTTVNKVGRSRCAAPRQAQRKWKLGNARDSSQRNCWKMMLQMWTFVFAVFDFASFVAFGSQTKIK